MAVVLLLNMWVRVNMPDSAPTLTYPPPLSHVLPPSSTLEQECVYHKATLDGKTPMILAMLAKQTSLMYEETQRCFNAPLLKAHFSEQWITHLQLKVGRCSHIQSQCFTFRIDSCMRLFSNVSL